MFYKRFDMLNNALFLWTEIAHQFASK